MSLKLVRNDLEKRIRSVISESGRLRAFLNKDIYRIYQKAQDLRWRSENRSEGERWAPVSDEWNRRKIRDRIRDRSRFPGGPRRMIHTAELSRSVIGIKLDHHRKIVTNRAITIATTLEYAGFVAEKRPFMKFGPKTERDFHDALKRFLGQQFKRSL